MTSPSASDDARLCNELGVDLLTIFGSTEAWTRAY